MAHRRGRPEAIIIGDSRWDIEAAGKAKLCALGLRCGGFPEAWRFGVGAAAVYDGPDELLARYPAWLGAA